MWVVVGSIPGLDMGYIKRYVPQLLSVLPFKSRGSTSCWDETASYPVISRMLLTNEPIIRRVGISATGGVGKEATNK